jgi:chromosomal replication initiation ATPase DnaA
MIQWIEGTPVQVGSGELEERPYIFLGSVLESVAREFGVSVEALKSPRRAMPLPAIRAEFCRRAFAMDQYSLPQIGRAIRRDHTTVIYLLGRNQKKPSKAIEVFLREHHNKAV